VRSSRLPSVRAPQWSPGSSHERNALAGEGARQCKAGPDVPMIRLEDLKTDSLVKGLVGKEAERMIGALGLVDPEARAVETNWTGTH